MRAFVYSAPWIQPTRTHRSQLYLPKPVRDDLASGCGHKRINEKEETLDMAKPQGSMVGAPNPGGVRESAKVDHATTGRGKLLRDEFDLIESQVEEAIEKSKRNPRLTLAGNALFLQGGRVYCGPRSYGESRYPYGHGGTHLWATASGRFYGNRGLFYYFLPPVTGQDPSVSFVAGARHSARDKFQPFSLLPVPFLTGQANQNLKRFSVFGHDAVWYFIETQNVRGGVRFSIGNDALGNTAMVWSRLLVNKSNVPTEFYVSSYFNPHFRHQFHETHEDRWFKKTYLSKSDDRDPRSDFTHRGALNPFMIEVNEDQNRFGSITHFGLLRRSLISNDSSGAPLELNATQQVATSQGAYVGSVNRNLSTASFLDDGRFASQPEFTVFHDNAVVGDLQTFVLPPQACVRLDYELCHHQLLDDFEANIDNPLTPWNVDHRLERIRASYQRSRDRIALQFKSKATAGALNANSLNCFVPFLRRQVEVCASTEGYMHASPNSLIGVRDLMQAIEASLIEDPTMARRRILECLAHVLVDGRSPRQYSLSITGDITKADLREFVDQGVWVVSTIYSYIAWTGDLEILNESVGYQRIVDPVAGTTTATKEKDSVLDHLLGICNYLDEQRDPETGLVRALYGDWNDALDGLGVRQDGQQGFGSGVSVMVSLQFFQNCQEMAEMLHTLDASKYGKDISKLERSRADLCSGLQRHAVVSNGSTRRIIHGWGDARAYIVGGFNDVDGKSRDGLTSYAFWVLSGMRQEVPAAISDTDLRAAFSRLDSPYGLKTFHPGFCSDARGVGRIRKLPIGTAENAATYVHASLFGVAALFSMGESELAWDQLIKLLPFVQESENLSHSPFVMPNSYAHNIELGLDGQSMNDWQTGSSNVLLKTLIRHVVGVQPRLSGITIRPANYYPFDEIAFRCRLGKKMLSVDIARSDVAQRTIGVLDENRCPIVRESERTDVTLVEAQLSTMDNILVEVRDPIRT